MISQAFTIRDLPGWVEGVIIDVYRVRMVSNDGYVRMLPSVGEEGSERETILD